MSAAKSMSSTLSNTSQTYDFKWDEAIRDAQEEIETLAKQQKRLQRAVRIFKANKRDGVPWPEKQKSPQEGGQ